MKAESSNVPNRLVLSVRLVGAYFSTRKRNGRKTGASTIKRPRVPSIVMLLSSESSKIRPQDRQSAAIVEERHGDILIDAMAANSRRGRLEARWSKQG